MEKMPLKHRPQLQLAARSDYDQRKSAMAGNWERRSHRIALCVRELAATACVLLTARRLIIENSQNHDHHRNWQKKNGLGLQNAENSQGPNLT